ncbi:MAG TPA: hypothetical protein VG106_12875, partial [Vicinamibacterales bacterium]|nr:hypothetical protein [Vicinamibacterales bacterium]
GCPNITDYFSPESFVGIDIDDYKGSIQAIEKALEEDAYGKYRQHVIEAKHRVLDELQVFPHLVRLLEIHKSRMNGARRSKRELMPATKKVEVLGGSKLERLVLEE